MSLTARVDGSGVQRRLNGTSPKVFTAIRRELEKQTGMLANYVRAEKLSGQVLKNRSGNLRNAVQNDVTASGPILTGIVFVDNTAPYGAYQEYGASIPERVPVNAKALRWYVGGSPVFAMRAKAFVLPPRPFMAPSLTEKSPSIKAALQASSDAAIASDK